MAKKVDVVKEQPEVKVAPKEQIVEVVADTPQVVEVVTASKAVKQVKIRTTEEIDCIIGKKSYQSRKDKDLEVPADVAAILVTARKAYRK